MPLTSATGAPIRLAYCTNVASAASPAALLDGLADLWSDVGARVGGSGPLGLGLWFEDAVARTLAGSAPDRAELAERLDALDLELVTVNAFPARAFHAPVVKERVYLPSWTDPDRSAYTSAVAWTIAGLVPPGSDVPVSTLPLGYPKLDATARAAAARRLLATVHEFHRLEEETGVTLRLALEPEPCCALERTDEALDFFERELLPAAGPYAELALRHLGVCLDLCHAAVEHEDPVAALGRYAAAGVPVHKVQVSAALEVPDPADATQRALLAPFAEERWLHQVGRAPGEVVLDVAHALASPDFADRGPWRVHFHVPLDAAEVGGLPTTRPLVERFLDHVATLDAPPVLELETYTWSVVPGASDDLAENVAREIRWARDRLLAAGCRRS